MLDGAASFLSNVIAQLFIALFCRMLSVITEIKEWLFKKLILIFTGHCCNIYKQLRQNSTHSHLAQYSVHQPGSHLCHSVREKLAEETREDLTIVYQRKR